VARVGRGIRGFFSGMVRGVSNGPEGSKILCFLFRSRLVCSSLLHLQCSWKVTAAKFALRGFSEVRRFLGALEHILLWSTYTPLTQEYAALVTWPSECHVTAQDSYLPSF
jgi:hypothetical protein